MSKKYNYPTDYELEEVLSSITDRKFLNEFSQERGIFIVNSKKDQHASELSVLFYEEQDIEAIRREAYNTNNSHSLNGFILNNAGDKFNLKNIYENIRENGLAGTGIILSNLIKVNQPHADPDISNIFKATIEHTKKKVGRMEFLQDESSSFDVYMMQRKGGEWQVEVDCNKSADAKEFRKILEKNISSEINFDTIDQDSINTENAILFFDKLAQEGMGSDWICIDVKHVTVRKGKDESDARESENENEIDNGSLENEAKNIEVDDEDLIEIKQAILLGRNLRENKVVKQFEKDGYRFSAMTFEFEHKSEPFVIQIRAEFKGKPKVFEVSIKSYLERTGVGSIKKPAMLTDGQNRAIRSQFWNNAKEIFDNL